MLKHYRPRDRACQLRERYLRHSSRGDRWAKHYDKVLRAVILRTKGRE